MSEEQEQIVTDDLPEVENVEEDEEIEEIDEDELLATFDEDELEDLPDDDDDDEDDDEESEEASEGESEEAEESAGDTPQTNDKGDLIDPNTGEKLIPQSELNKIMGNARIKGREYEEHARLLEQMTGMPLNEVTQHVRDQQVNRMEEEYGVPREQASRFVENEQKVSYLEEQLLNLYNQQQQNQVTSQYNQEKQQHMNNPLVRKYEAEIDAVSQGGQQLGWEAAMRYVLGEKLVSGEVADNIKNSEQQKQQKVSKRSKVAPEGGSGGGAPAREAPKELQNFAKAFGIPVSEAIDEYEKINKNRKL